MVCYRYDSWAVEDAEASALRGIGHAVEVKLQASGRGDGVRLIICETTIDETARLRPHLARSLASSSISGLVQGDCSWRHRTQEKGECMSAFECQRRM